MAIKIFIDQGHNPVNPNAGAEGNGLREQDITYSVGVILADLLRQNGRVVLVDRPLDELSDKGRPVSQAKGVERLAAERMHLYHEWADVILRCTGSAQSDAELVKELLRL